MWCSGSVKGCIGAGKYLGVTRKAEDLLKSLGYHFPVERNKSSPHVELIERFVNLPTGGKLVWLQNFQVDLTETSLDIIRHGTPLCAYKVQKNLHWNVMDIRGRSRG